MTTTSAFAAERLTGFDWQIQSLYHGQSPIETVCGPDNAAATLGASYEITKRLRRLTRPYCGTANPVGDSNCVACSGPLGYRQAIACDKCGFVSEAGTSVCPNCGEALPE
ncbi:MAG: zinc ribbon domain-containing protein [Anaerolineales bacterium]